MDPVPAPQPEIDQLVTKAVAPRSGTHWRALTIFALVGLLGAAGLAYSQGLLRLPNPATTTSPTATSSAVALADDPTPSSGTQIYFAQIIDEYLSPDPAHPQTSRYFPIFNIYHTNTNLTGRKRILTTSNMGDKYVDRFIFVPTQRLLLVQYEFGLTGYGLTSGQTQFSVAGTYNKNGLWGATVSPDQSQLVLTQLSGTGIGSESTSIQLPDKVDYQIITVDLKSFEQKVIYQQSGVKVSDLLRPITWSLNNKIIYLIPPYYNFDHDGLFPVYAMNSDGTDLHKQTQPIPATPRPEQISSLGGYLAYTDTFGGPTTSNCYNTMGNPVPDTTIWFHNLTTDSKTLFDFNPDLWYKFVRWSPDGTEFVYSTEQLDLAKACGSQLQPAKYHLYNLTTKKITDVATLHNQLKQWEPEEPIVTTTPEALIINGQTVTKAFPNQIFPLAQQYLGFIKAK